MKNTTLLRKHSLIALGLLEIARSIYPFNIRARRRWLQNALVAFNNNSPIIIPTDLRKRHLLGDFLGGRMEVIHYLPSNLNIHGSLTVDEAWECLQELPSNLTIQNNLLILKKDLLNTLPDGLHVIFDFILGNQAHLTELPSDLCVNGTLDIRETKVKNLSSYPLSGGIIVGKATQKLPSCQTIHGHLGLQDCQHALSLEHVNKIEGSLLLDSSEVHLPSELKITGNMVVGSTCKFHTPAREINIDGDLIYFNIGTSENEHFASSQLATKIQCNSISYYNLWEEIPVLPEALHTRMALLVGCTSETSNKLGHAFLKMGISIQRGSVTVQDRIQMQSPISSRINLSCRWFYLKSDALLQSGVVQCRS